ncbi:MAG: hypothetical protein M8353_00270 [ANME-2 cluster archaeon]|nr:hypothetical protein [ANME-2 cluster archaeon]
MTGQYTSFSLKEAGVEIGESITLMMKMGRSGSYPASNIQKGLVLVFRGTDLSEEGIGFGVPLIRCGWEAVFPGSACITLKREGDRTVVNTDYDLRLVERMIVKEKKRIESRTFYRITGYLSTLHRNCPPLRKILALSSGIVRRITGMNNQFEVCNSRGIVKVVYTIEPGVGLIHVSVDASGVKECETKEIMIMNEQGASHFEQYTDTCGIALTGDEIGTWDETFADEASFIDCRNNIEFTLQNVKGARVFRGREHVPGRLAWAGLACVLPRSKACFTYSIRVGRHRV